MRKDFVRLLDVVGVGGKGLGAGVLQKTALVIWLAEGRSGM